MRASLAPAVGTLVLGLCNALPARGEECPVWTSRTPGPPPGRTGFGTAYDDRRQVLVLFGGTAFPGGVHSETWEWNGRRWDLRSTVGPSPRMYPAMTYDAQRGVVLLHGGCNTFVNPPTVVGDAWTWDGVDWRVVPEPGPPALCRHRVVFDSSRGVAVLFGGVDAGFAARNELWEWDGVSWSLRSADGPSPRAFPGLAFDATAGHTILFGGLQIGPTFLGDTWTWDGTAWTQLTVAGPSPRAFHGMAFDPIAGLTVLVSGFATGTVFRDTWEWNGKSWAQAPGSVPTVIGPGGSAHFDAAESTVVTLDSTLGRWRWDSPTWTELRVPQPSQRRAHAMAYDSGRGVTVLFGGEDIASHDLVNDTWEWDGQTWILRDSGSGPSPRWFPRMAFDSARGVVVLHGGSYSASSLGDTWEWNGAVWRARDDAPTPGPYRDTFGMAYDSAQQVTVVAGGDGPAPDGVFDWDGKTWTHHEYDEGPSDATAIMAYDSVRQLCVLFGGGSFDRQTWEWDGARWFLRAQGIPSRRSYGAMVYDDRRNLSLMFGGESAGVFDETWGWDGSEWRLLTSIGPGPRSEFAMTFDSRRGVTVLFGGIDHNHIVYQDTWELDFGAVSFDADLDCDLDLRDFGLCVNCLTDPSPTLCGQCTVETDAPANLRDLLRLARAMGGPIR